MLFADSAVLAYDAAANAWTTVERGPGWPTGCTVGGVAVDPTARVGHQMVFDPISEAPAVDDVWAYHLASNTWTQLLAPCATPSLGPG